MLSNYTLASNCDLQAKKAAVISESEAFANSSSLNKCGGAA
jgi:hypothetical protein